MHWNLNVLLIYLKQFHFCMRRCFINKVMKSDESYYDYMFILFLCLWTTQSGAAVVRSVQLRTDVNAFVIQHGWFSNLRPLWAEGNMVLNTPQCSSEIFGQGLMFVLSSNHNRGKVLRLSWSEVNVNTIALNISTESEQSKTNPNTQQNCTVGGQDQAMRNYFLGTNLSLIVSQSIHLLWESTCNLCKYNGEGSWNRFLSTVSDLGYLRIYL